jgi:hypothetical protein
MKQRTLFLKLIFILIFLFLTACNGKGTPVPSTNSMPTDATVPALTNTGELTFEQHRAMFPPPPKNLTINPEGNAVLISWEAADPVTIPHGYGDKVLYYKVFRRAEKETDPVQIGTTTAPSFFDAKRTAQDKYYYSIVEVHDGLAGGELDGDRSEESYWGG